MESREKLANRIGSGVSEEFVRDEMRRVRKRARVGCQVTRVIEMQPVVSQSRPDQNLPAQQTPNSER